MGMGQTYLEHDEHVPMPGVGLPVYVSLQLTLSVPHLVFLAKFVALHSCLLQDG